jgi:hypothetical protein
MLAVLVNEPGLFQSVADCLDADRIADAGLRRIAAQVRHLAETVGEFRLSELLLRLTDPRDTELATDLAVRGAQIGNYAETLEGSAARLRALSSARDTRRLTEEVKRQSAESEPLSDEEIRERLSRIGTRLASRSGFAHRRAINELSGAAPETVESAEGVGRQK